MGKKILIVDDNHAIIESISMLLEIEGYEFETLYDGESLIRHDLSDVGLVLLDIWLSGSDGGELTKVIKKDKSKKDTPIVLISAKRDVEDVAYESGANGFIYKPFEIEDLLRVINTHIN